MKRPVHVISASVPPGNRLRGFSGPANDLQSLLVDPPTFRRSGFDVSIPDVPRVGPEGSIEIGGERKLLRIFQDGTALFRMAADGAFLGWGLGEDAFLRWPRLNPVPVVEAHTSFVYFYRELLRRLKSSPARVNVKLKLVGGDVGAGRLFLTPYYRAQFDPFAMERHFLQMDPAVEELTFDPAEIENRPNRAAYRIVAAFVAMFDMAEEDIPFVRETGADREIDVDAIKNIKR